MSRTQAAGKRNRKTGACSARARHARDDARLARERGVILRGGGLDESPHAYRRLPEVLAAQERTVEVLHTLRPLVVVMAGRRRVRPVQGLGRGPGGPWTWGVT
jgi:tRNA-splicing ligase RtcB